MFAYCHLEYSGHTQGTDCSVNYRLVSHTRAGDCVPTPRNNSDGSRDGKLSEADIGRLAGDLEGTFPDSKAKPGGLASCTRMQCLSGEVETSPSAVKRGRPSSVGPWGRSHAAETRAGSSSYFCCCHFLNAH